MYRCVEIQHSNSTPVYYPVIMIIGYSLDAISDITGVIEKQSEVFRFSSDDR
jgi:hypothetical protein